jgi:hypothetical protein
MTLDAYCEKLETLPKEILWDMVYALGLEVHPCATLRKISTMLAIKLTLVND